MVTDVREEQPKASHADHRHRRRDGDRGEGGAGVEGLPADPRHRRRDGDRRERAVVEGLSPISVTPSGTVAWPATIRLEGLALLPPPPPPPPPATTKRAVVAPPPPPPALRPAAAAPPRPTSRAPRRLLRHLRRLAAEHSLQKFPQARRPVKAGAWINVRFSLQLEGHRRQRPRSASRAATHRHRRHVGHRAGAARAAWFPMAHSSQRPRGCIGRLRRVPRPTEALQLSSSSGILSLTSSSSSIALRMRFLPSAMATYKDMQDVLRVRKRDKTATQQRRSLHQTIRGRPSDGRLHELQTRRLATHAPVHGRLPTAQGRARRLQGADGRKWRAAVVLAVHNNAGRIRLRYTLDGKVPRWPK